MEEEVEEEFTVEMENRMHAPLEWYSPPVCKIQDLKEAQYDEALRLIKVQRRERENLERNLARVCIRRRFNCEFSQKEEKKKKKE